ncbi:MAG: hypothetical protein K2X93_07020 [Candidatus Obscuribacterales bacterium]|nr:hypothetical protein [Candidatus Obscuribacterales bacterium]
MIVLDKTIENRIKEHRDRWVHLARSCDDLNVQAVQEGVALTYLMAGIPPPDRLLWLDSPLCGAVAAAVFNKLYENLHIRIWHKPLEQMTQELFSSKSESLPAVLWHEIDRKLKLNPLGIQDKIVAPIRTQIGRQLEVRFGLRADPRESLQLVNEDVWSYILARVQQQMSDEEFALLTKMIYDSQFASACSSQGWYCGLGGQDVENLELLSFAEELGMDIPLAKGILALSRQSSWWWAFDKVCIVTYRPQMLLLDSDERLHNDFGPAIEFPDGWTVYARHGMPIPPRVTHFAHRKDLKEIESEQNAEIRRHLIEVYGVEKYLIDAEAIKIDEDSCGILYRKDFIGDEPLKMVKVLNSTPEPDGTSRWYYLRVPPNVETAREAVAWTFFMDADEYNPEQET